MTAPTLTSPRSRPLPWRRPIAYSPPAIIIAIQLVVFPMPLGVFINGVIIGAVTALIALGMALIYRSNRIINFAQGDLGAAPPVLVFLSLSEWGWPYPLAVAAGAASAFLLGGFVELAVIRRFFRAPRLVLTVATIGLATILTGLAILLPSWFDAQLLAPRIEDPFDAQLTVGTTIFSANSLIAVVVAPLALIGLAIFLRGTSLGIAIRASADRADRASLLGVPVKRLQTLVWAVAALLAFTAIFLRAGILGLPVGSALSLGLLLRSLTALLLGGLTRLPVIGLSAIAIGVLELGVGWNSGDNVPFLDSEWPPLDAILVVVVLAALLLRRRSAGRTDLEDQSSWQSADEVRPIPSELARLPQVRWVRLGLFALGVAFLIVLPHFLTVDHSLKASAVAIYAILTLSLVVLTGWAGQVSLGQVAFFAIGAAVAGKLTQAWNVGLLLAVLLAGLLGAVAAVVVGLPALRFRGLYLAVTTFAFALATTGYLLNRSYFEWVPNERIPTKPILGILDVSSPTSIYYVALVALALTLVGLRGVRHSRTGRVLIALRDNERGAQAYGVSAVRAKPTAFALSGFVAAAAGALFVHHQHAFGSGPYAPSENLAVFTIAVVGGITSLAGAALGALYLQGSQWFLPLEWQFLASGFGVLLVLLVLPGGLGGLAFKIRDHYLRWVARRFDLVVPSLLADSMVDEERRDPEATPLPGRADERPKTEPDRDPEPEPVGARRGD